MRVHPGAVQTVSSALASPLEPQFWELVGRFRPWSSLAPCVVREMTHTKQRASAVWVPYVAVQRMQPAFPSGLAFIIIISALAPGAYLSQACRFASSGVPQVVSCLICMLSGAVCDVLSDPVVARNLPCCSLNLLAFQPAVSGSRTMAGGFSDLMHLLLVRREMQHVCQSRLPS